MDNIERAFLSAIRSRDLLPPGPVTAAVSGGADSVCMLHLLQANARRMGWRLGVLHVDHSSRSGSAADAGFVGRLAGDLGLPCRIERLGRAPGGRSQECRFSEARQRIYESVHGGGRVAVAHTASDRAETLLLRLLEGAGLRGAGGMDWFGVGPVVRPMLDITREQARSWLESRGLPWVEDPTNQDRRMARNRLRLDVMPALEEAFPGASLRLSSASAGLASWRRVADGLSECALERASLPCGRGTALDRQVFMSFESAVRMSISWMLCGRPRAGSGELARTDAWLAEGRTGRRLLPGGTVLEAGTAVLVFREAEEGERRRRGSPDKR